MDHKLLTLIISLSVSSITLLVGWIKWKNDFTQKLRKLREDVNKEIIQIRIEAYTELINKLKVFSNFSDLDDKINKKVVSKNRHLLHDSFFNKAGLVCTHETRQLMLYVLLGFNQFLEDDITILQLKYRLWSLHFSMRSDLGIIQPDWEDTIDKLMKNRRSSINRKSIQQLVENYPWHKYDYRSRNN